VNLLSQRERERERYLGFAQTLNSSREYPTVEGFILSGAGETACSGNSSGPADEVYSPLNYPHTEALPDGANRYAPR
jgi:hypothetical protein